MIKVLVADDEQLIRTGIRAVLESAADITVVAEAGDGRAAVGAALASRPDVALLDISMPLADGLTAAKEIMRHSPGTRVLVLTSFGTEPNAQGAIEAGTAGFLLKSCAPEELLRAVRAAHVGQAYLSPQVTRFVLNMIPRSAVARAQRAQARLTALSPRESQVIALLAEGKSNASIAGQLRMTETTAKNLRKPHPGQTGLREPGPGRLARPRRRGAR